ncbi:MAG: ParM/StbA family protein [Cetobacterium sp.]|nr:ParM/StbA family protein [Cetobacterium sp.]
MIVGIDYGAINCKNSKGIIFENKIKTDELISSNENTIVFDDKEYIFGKGEYDFSKDIKFNQERFLPLLFASLASIGTTDTFDVMLGLPIKHYKKHKEKLKKLILENKNKSIIFKGKTINISIDKVDVFPEGLGVLYSLTDEELSKFDKRDILIIDIGGSTTDIALLTGNGLDREIIKIHTVTCGMHNIFDDIKNYIIENTEDESITIEKAQQILEGKVIHSVNGVDTDLEFIEDIKLNNTLKILKDMKLKFSNELKSAMWLVCGGGSKILYPYLKHIQPNAINNT